MGGWGDCGDGGGSGGAGTVEGVVEVVTGRAGKRRGMVAGGVEGVALK